jgi:exopolyphosphatase/guanosine-5'-triphosphate,3'-diphosphate pyrophosphatase
LQRPGQPGAEGYRSLTQGPVAVIDIGSNSVRLVAYDLHSRAPVPMFNEKSLCGLGREVAVTGFLPKDGLEQAIAALKRFRVLCDLMRVEKLYVLATAAARRALNGPAFIAEVKDILRSDVTLLTGAEEARLAALGVLAGNHNPDGLAGDLGGGSLELIDVSQGQVGEGVSLELGGLALRDAAGKSLKKAGKIVLDALSGVPIIRQAAGRDIIAIGGTWRAIARLHMEKTNYPLRVMHGYTMPTDEAIEFCEDIRKARRLSAMPGIEEVSRPRREVLPYGALVLERLLKRLEPSVIDFSVFGIREGLVYSLLAEAERRKDPLISFCTEFARQRSRSADHAVELCEWTDALFEPPGPKEAEEERRLRHAACLLSDISWRAHPDYRGEQSLIMIAHAALAGIDHPGRVFLALASYFRHVGTGSDAEDEGSDKLPDRLKTILSKRAYKRARIIGAAIRAAHMLSIGRPGIIDQAPLAYERGKLVLTVPKAFAALDGERLRRRFAALAALLEREPDIRIRG